MQIPSTGGCVCVTDGIGTGGGDPQNSPVGNEDAQWPYNIEGLLGAQWNGIFQKRTWLAVTLNLRTPRCRIL